jgi:hypothetical protein
MPTSVGLSAQYPHPPLAFVRRAASADNPFSGYGEFSSPDLLGFGLVWHVVSVPPGIGVTDGYLYRYQERLFQLSIEHDLLVGSGTVTTQLEESDLGDGLLWFANTLPSHIHYWIFPGGVRLAHARGHVRPAGLLNAGSRDAAANREAAAAARGVLFLGDWQARPAALPDDDAASCPGRSCYDSR